MPLGNSQFYSKESHNRCGLYVYFLPEMATEPSFGTAPYFAYAMYSSRPGVGNLISAKGHLDIYNIIRGPYKIINLKISLLYLVKHLINSPLM
jgi:hypothetical protein